MGKDRLVYLVNFFKKLQVTEEDVTSSEERENGQFAVIATYKFENKIFKTKKLYYKNINQQSDVKNPASINSHFGKPVFWLDHTIHLWPKGKKEAEVEITIIKDMINDGDSEFESFLKQLANNKNKGLIQEFTMDGRRQQYGFNLENNNHWHDIINLIKAFIDARGEAIDKQWYNRLVFEWQPKGRTSLSPDLGDRAIITALAKNIKSIQLEIMNTEIINLLEYKKQIILQGPPGTGKTYTAKDIAEYMINEKLSANKEDQKIVLEQSDQFKLIQFHPSYTYEDFVRGIVAKPNDDGEGVLYEAENKTLGIFAKKALENYQLSRDNTTVLKQINDFSAFVNYVIEQIGEHEKYEISDKVYIHYADDKRFKYKGDNWTAHPNGISMSYSELRKILELGLSTRQDVNKCEQLNALTRQHATYFQNVVELYKQFKNEQPDVKKDVVKEKKFVLVIDEINRANLPSVLGELIYALEYRGKSVESMYELEGEGKSLTIPPNLYIIGTMNTADRSVGHIDYAIRRRFAFVDVLPKPEPIKEFALKKFKLVSELFIKNYESITNWENPKLERSDLLAPDFRPEDVWIGHSYFIADDEEQLKIKLQYEVKPILKEYLKDGILLDGAKSVIDKIEWD